MILELQYQLTKFMVCSNSKRGLTKPELANSQLRKPLFPNDATQKTGLLVYDIYALDDEAAAVLRKANEDLTGKEDMLPGNKKPKL